MRVALTRLVQQGKATAKARGVYAWNPSGHGLLRDVRNWLHKEKHMIAWSGGWVAVADAGIPRSERGVLKRHVKALELRGFKPFKNGLHLRPDNLQGGVERLREELLELGLASSATVFVISGLAQEDASQAWALWDTQALQNAYSASLARLAESDVALASMNLQQAAVHSLLEGRRVIRDIVLDPLLPEEMFASAKRHQLIERMTAYQAKALKIWVQALEQA